jgi:hypothetical protein
MLTGKTGALPVKRLPIYQSVKKPFRHLNASHYNKGVMNQA